MLDTTNDTEADISGRVVLSVRINASEKLRLQEAATALGLLLSDYAESILVNRDRFPVSSDKERLEQELEVLRRKIAELEPLTSIYSDPELLKLYNHLKGKSDTITTRDGKQMTITYNSIRDVLIAIIYSIKPN